MNTSQTQELISRAIEEKHLLDHPFYQRWESGELALQELVRYAQEYRHIEAELPATLTTLLHKVVPSEARQLIQGNLDDELSNPTAHTELFESFATAVGATASSTASLATSQLVETYRALALEGPVAGLACIAAYETQASAIANTKGTSLRKHYQLTADETAFWDLHARLEDDHASWTADALTALAGNEAEIIAAARRSAEAWWNFLDERESESQLIPVG